MKAHDLPVLGPQGFLNLAYWEWQGPAAAPTVLCVHGLTGRIGHAPALMADDQIAAIRDFLLAE